MDIPKLAADIANLLAPFLPYLISAGETAAKKASEKFGEAVWNEAVTVWQKLKPKAEEKPLLKEAAEKVARKPEDKRVIGNLEVELEEAFNEDVPFAETVDGIYNSIVIGRDVNNSNILNNSNNNQIAGGNITNIFPPQPDAETQKINKARDNYLRNLIIFCNLLPLTALGDEKSAADSITLENVYINLDTDTLKEDKDGKAERSRKGEIEFEREKKTPISCMEVATKEDKLVLLGNAGSGKSSFVKHLIAKQAVAVREGKPSLKGFSPDLIPVYIELRKLSPRLKELNLDNLARHEKMKKLSDVAFEQLKQEAQERSASEFFSKIEEAFNEGDILLVLDGLDEVPQALREIVRLTVEALIQLHKIKKIIITSRPNAYKKLFDNFADYNIALLDEEKIQKFAQEWYSVQLAFQKVNEEEAQEKAQDLARRAVEEIPNEMSGNPMMLTCVAIIHKSGRVFPKHRAVLFNEIVDILSSKWQEEKAGAIADVELAEVLKDKKLLRKALEGLAYKTHRSNYEAGGNTEEADLSYGKAYGLLREPEYFGSGKLAGAFLDYIYQQSGLFHSHGGEQTTYRFPHRQIQEYLAGCYLIGQDNCEELYKAHAAQGDFWSASALLGAEEIIYIQDKAERILLNIMYELCPSQAPKTEGTERAVLWAGQIAVQFGIEKIEQKARGKDYLKDLTSHTLYLLEKSQFISPRERAEAGNTLSQLDDPRFDSETWYLPKESLFGFVRIPAGEFLMGTKQEDIKELMEKFGGEEDFYKPETPQHTLHLPDFYTSRYPVTASQFRTFVEDSAYKPDDEDSLKGVLNHPVRYVTWYDAIAYCQWLNKRLQEKAKQVEVKHEAEEKFWKGIKSGELIVTLPSEAEWEKSASSAPPLSKGEGLGVRVFSWGNDFDKEKANVAMNIGNTSPVGCFPNGKSFYDLQDTTGNVWEWTRSMYKPYKYNSKDGRENMDDKDSPRVLRGGSFDDNDWFVRCAGRDWSSPNYRYYYVGFRAVVSHFS